MAETSGAAERPATVLDSLRPELEGLSAYVPHAPAGIRVKLDLLYEFQPKVKPWDLPHPYGQRKAEHARVGLAELAGPRRVEIVVARQLGLARAGRAPVGLLGRGRERVEVLDLGEAVGQRLAALGRERERGRGLGDRQRDGARIVDVDAALDRGRGHGPEAHRGVARGGAGGLRRRA